MVVNDLDIKHITVGEAKTDSPLIINSDAPLSFTITLERFQMIRRWKPQIVNAGGSIKLRKTHDRAATYLWSQAPGTAGREEALCLGVCEGLDHSTQYKHIVYGRQADCLCGLFAAPGGEREAQRKVGDQ